MKSEHTLPEGYKQIYAVDLQKDKKIAFWINFLGLVFMAAMCLGMNFLVPISNLFDWSAGEQAYWIRFGSILGLMVVYMVLHELVHGVAMKLCGTKKVKYGFTGMYAYAGSEDYYCKKAYIFIALAPVVLWGVVLAVINFFVSPQWFWVIYMIQVVNLSGAAGDVFVTAKFSQMPKDILIQDSGVGMTVYSRQ